MLSKNEYPNSTIFYTPISAWLFFLVMFLVLLLPILVEAIPIIWESSWEYLLLYLCCAYLVAAYLHNSFAIAEGELLVINPNFPFRKVRSYPLSSVLSVQIAQSRWLSIVWLFGSLGKNFVEIRTFKGKFRYYCTSLDIDCYDENQTRLTLDDFHVALRQEEVSVDFGFD